MSEKQRLFAILFFPLLVSFLIFKIPPVNKGYLIQDYEINLKMKENSAVINEKITYALNRTYHELYRWFYTANNPFADMRILNASCPRGSIFEVHKGRKTTELVCSGFFPPGKYDLEFSYEVPKPYKCAQDGCLFHWVAFDGFSTQILNLYGRINSEKFVTFPTGKIEGDRFYISKMDENTPFEILAFVPAPREAFSLIKSAKDEFEKKKMRIVIIGKIYEFRRKIFPLIAVLFTLALLSIYLKYGRDLNPSAPEILHYPPEDLPPHELDFLYGRFIGKLEKEMGDAVLLDLARRGIVKIEEKKIIIYPEKAKGLDEFESNFLGFYIKYGKREGNQVVFDVEDFKKRLKNENFAFRASMHLALIKEPTKKMKEKLKSIYDRSGSNLALGIAVLYVVLPFVIFYFYPGIFRAFSKYFLALLSQGFSTLFLLITLDDFVFGRYTKEGRIKKAYWDAFARLLRDYSLIKKYAPKDINMWGKWLVYATVFGCAENVVKAMKELRIAIPNMRGDIHIHSSIHSFTSSAVHSHGGGIGGGGFGGGGGGAR